MRKTHAEKVMQAFAKQEPYEREASPFWTNGYEVLSYWTTLLYRDTDGTYYHNTSHYSMQTGSHQRTVRDWLAVTGIRPIRVPNMPRGSRAADLIFHGKTLGPVKQAQLDECVEHGLAVAAALLHTPIMGTERPSIVTWTIIRCVYCEHKLTIAPRYAEGHDARHFDTRGNLTRYRCSQPRLWLAH